MENEEHKIGEVIGPDKPEKPEESATKQPDNEPAAPQPKPHEEKPHSSPSGESRWERFRAWYVDHKKIAIPASVLVFILILFGIPFSRYMLAGMAIKKDVSLQILDAKTHSPVSGADVVSGSAAGVTDGSGKAMLHGVKVGNHTVKVTKKYYTDSQSSVLVPILSKKGLASINLQATGRQVKIIVNNSIDQQKLQNVDIEVSGIDAKTDKNGEAIVVVPEGTTIAKAKLSAKGYNDAEVNLKVSDSEVKENKFNLTPTGKIYFLSKLSGKIDVVKTDLDGSNRQTILAGTGREEDRNTVLLASRDWKYLALLSKRDTADAKLYLIDTSDDKVTSMDEGSATFFPVGWSDDNFIYRVDRNNVAVWQPHAQALKSYNAANHQNLILDQTNATGTNDTDYAKESYGTIYQLGKNVVYSKDWQGSYYSSTALDDKHGGIYSIGVTGGNAQTLKSLSYEAGKSTYVTSVPYEASSIYYNITEKGTAGYFAYSNGKVTAKSDIADEFDEYYAKAVTYLQSPSGSETFWAEERDGKNTLFVGDDSGKNGKQVASLSEYLTYGWFTDNYLLVSKGSSELYILPKKGVAKDDKPVKISDYHKPSQSFRGYGGGYGGI